MPATQAGIPPVQSGLTLVLVVGVLAARLVAGLVSGLAAGPTRLLAGLLVILALLLLTLLLLALLLRRVLGVLVLVVFLVHAVLLRKAAPIWPPLEEKRPPAKRGCWPYLGASVAAPLAA